jgi:CheY-like chemotaxis protein
VETAVSKGTTFRVYLPVAAGPAPAAAPAERPARRIGDVQATVFVAEDEEAVRVLLRTVLGGVGFTVIEASSGTEAAAMLESIDQPIDLLITDIIMPGMIGPDLARLVLQRFPQTRVLYITGYATHSAVPAGFLQEGDALLHKPFLPDQLLDKVYDRLSIAS